MYYILILESDIYAGIEEEDDYEVWFLNIKYFFKLFNLNDNFVLIFNKFICDI